MNTSPEEFKRRLRKMQNSSKFMLLFVLLQTGMLMVFCALCRSIPASKFYFIASVLGLLSALSTSNYAKHLRFLKVYRRCVSLIVRLESVPLAQFNLRGCLQEQLEAEVEKLCAATGSVRHDSTGVPD